MDGDDIVGDLLLRRPNESGVSVNRLEAFAPPLENQLTEIRRRSRLTYKPKGRLVSFHIATLKRELLRSVSAHIDVVARPLEDEGKHLADPSHAELLGMPQENTPEGELLRDLVALCANDILPAVSSS